ncbi:cupin domain-containing protein [Sphaerisporangium aureirubrum]|uniref:Cupin domain-containing protein n=1 Tax=Sphaerisporangium aureirubrum TaxID=1544736 RepID=A0ABW1NGC9_9ACTN
MRFASEDGAKATPGDAKRFTDGVHETRFLEAVRENGLRAQRFSYIPNARSGWHVHDGEQALYVVAGRGVIARWGEAETVALGPGDWVHVEPGEKHWHGAAPDATFVHLAVTASGATHWHGPVTDEEYAAASQTARKPGEISDGTGA